RPSSWRPPRSAGCSSWSSEARPCIRLPAAGPSVSETARMRRPRAKPWSVLSHHGTVLLHVAWHPDATVVEIGNAVGLTERWVRKILDDLEDAGMVAVTKRGVQNHYAVNFDVHL